MAVFTLPRTYTGKWFGTWFGNTTYNWFGPFPTGRGVLVERSECDCCYGTCHCENCLTFGYWNEYEATIPVPYGYYSPWTTGSIGTSAAYAYFLLTGPRTITPLTPVFVNFGIVNNCCFEYLENNIEFTHLGTDYTITQLYVLYCPNATNGGSQDSFLEIRVVEPNPSYPYIPTQWTQTFINETSSAEDCHDPPTLTALDASSFLGSTPWVLNWYDTPPMTVEPVPTGTATWTSCGTDEDGAPVIDPGEEGPMSLPAGLFETATVGGKRLVVKKRTPLPTARPDRCEHFGGRTEFKPGCNGWRCKGKCDLGLPAVPGKYCQTCEKYEPDPDYMGQGVPGWLK